MSDHVVRLAGDEFLVAVRRDGEVWRAEMEGGKVRSIELRPLSPNQAEIVVDGSRHVVWYAQAGDRFHIHFDGVTYSGEVMAPSARKRGRHRDHSMTAPMPGVVLKIFVAVSDVVSKGDPLLVLEAMKMEHQLTAPYDGVVEQILCKPGDLVQPGVELISIEEKKET